MLKMPIWQGFLLGKQSYLIGGFLTFGEGRLLTPTSASWLNAVEGFFAKLTRRRLMRGIFRSVDDLKAAINPFVAPNLGRMLSIR